jgi:hypothetical protein
MNAHLTDDELILHFYGETDRADEARVGSHLAACDECRRADQQLRRVMTLVGTASPVEAPPGFERIAWARLEPTLDANRRTWKSIFWLPQWALASGVAALVLAAFVAGRFSGGESAGVTPTSGPRATASPVVADLAERVLNAEVGDHLDRTQMMLAEFANAGADQADIFAVEQHRASDLVAVNRLIRQSVEQSGDAAVADVLEDLERLLLEIANAPVNAPSDELTDLQSRITAEDLLFRVRVIASEMRQRTRDRSTGDPERQRKMPVS